MYNNGTSLDSKLRNWSLLKNFIKSHKLDIPEDYVEGTIHCKEGAALLFIERLYEVLTNRQLRKSPNEELDFTDRSYQVRLPLHARSTASQSVKNNLRITELMADKRINTLSTNISSIAEGRDASSQTDLTRSQRWEI